MSPRVRRDTLPPGRTTYRSEDTGGEKKAIKKQWARREGSNSKDEVRRAGKWRMGDSRTMAQYSWHRQGSTMIVRANSCKGSRYRHDCNAPSKSGCN